MKTKIMIVLAMSSFFLFSLKLEANHQALKIHEEIESLVSRINFEAKTYEESLNLREKNQAFQRASDDTSSQIDDLESEFK